MATSSVKLRRIRISLVAGLMGLAMVGATSSQTQPLLQLQGQPYFGGAVSLHLSGAVGQPALLAYGLNPLPLDQPIQTGKGPWFIGSMINLVAIGNIPASGRIDLPFTMPPVMPAVAGIPLVMQGYVPFQLSNPATLPLDLPYFEPSAALTITSPEPQVQALFGDTLAVGDLNGDGHEDLVVGAWFDDWQGVDRSGRVYVFWGPDHVVGTSLEPTNPKVVGVFGCGLAVADLDGDSIDDLVIAETTGYPPVPGEPGRLHVYWGGSPWSPTSGLEIESAGTGEIYSLFGRRLTIGDYDNDGWADIAVGINKADVGGLTNAGRVDIYWGPGFNVRTELTSPDNGTDNFFGTALASGDVNGDGIDDLIEGSENDDVGGVVNLGSAHVFMGPHLSEVTTLAAPIPLGFNTSFGVAVAVLDTGSTSGLSVVVSDLKNHCFVYEPNTFTDPLVVSKPLAGTHVPLGATIFGIPLVAADANGDGQQDLLISDSFESSLTNCGSLLGAGRVYVALSPYFATFHVLEDVAPHCGDSFGWWAAAADLDGDGLAEIISGAKTADDNDVQNSGHVTVFPGGG